MTDEQAENFSQLVKKAQLLGLRFDCGTAYIKRSYVDKQNELNLQIDAALRELEEQDD